MSAAPNGQETVTDATKDPAALLKFFNEQSFDEFDGDTKGEGDADKAAAEKAAADEAAAAKAATDKAAADKAEAEKDAATKVATPAAKPDTEADADGVLAKDGKNVIPYSVLKGAREKATEAERLLTESKAANAALEQQLAEAKAGKPAAAADQAADLTDISDEDLEALKTEFPTLAKAIVAQRQQFKALEAKLTKATEAQASTSQQNERAAAVEQVQTAIDSIPKLAHIQATDPALWADAIALDKTLREMPRWNGRPQADRFKRVVELLEADAGEIKLPGTAKTTPEPTKAELKAAAEKELAAKAAEPDKPTSLSDAKGGEAPVDEKAMLATATPMQLQAKLARMTPDQLDSWLDSI